MTLIAAGQGLRKRANVGFAEVARLEGEENQQRIAQEMARDAQQAQMMGTGGGIGAMYGLKGLQGSGGVAAGAGGTPPLPVFGDPVTVGGITAVPEAGGVAIPGGVNVTSQVAGGAEVVTNTAAATEAATGAAAVTEAGATSAAAGGGGGWAGLASLAAPVAIGLGVAFLLNKLFD